MHSDCVPAVLASLLMTRLASLLIALIGIASPALADEPAPATPVVVLRGSSAPPTPWYEPPPEPKVIVQPVYVPLYYLPNYLPIAYGSSFYRQPLGPSAKRNR
jgi:hypothetical protein